MITACKWQFRPILIKHMELTVNISLDQQQRFFRHLLTVTVDQLDAVVIIRIVAGRDHNATIKVIHTCNISHRRRCGNMEQIGICTRSSQTSNQAVLKHIRAAASVLTDNDTSRISITVTLAQSIVIPA